MVVCGTLCLILVLFFYIYNFGYCNHLHGKERACCFILIVLLVSCDCKCSVSLPDFAVYWSAACDCGISSSYSLTYGGSSVTGEMMAKTCLGKKV